MSGAITPLPNTPSWRSAYLKHRDNFTFTFIINISSSKYVYVYTSVLYIYKVK
jgi:hypothetical protein